MQISNVIRENAKNLVLARRLNSRAGKKIFPVLDEHELREWLKTRINGARCASDIPDLNRIRIPAPDPSHVKEVFDTNPDEISLFGKSFSVDYDHGPTPSIEIDLYHLPNDDLKQFGNGKLSLPGGRNIEIILKKGGEFVSYISSPKDLYEAADRFSEVDRRKQLMARVKSEFEVSNIHGTEQIFSLLPSLVDQSVIIDGEVVAYKAFDYDKYGSGICLLESKIEADNFTQNSLRLFYRDLVDKVLTIPDSEVFYYKGHFSTTLRPLGKTLERRFDSLRRMLSCDLTLDNIQEKVDATKAKAEKIIAETINDPGLYGSNIDVLSFDSLIKNKRKEELSAIFGKVQETLGYDEEQIVKAIYSLTKGSGGVPKRGNTLWITLRDNFPGKEYSVDIEALSEAIMEIVEA